MPRAARISRTRLRRRGGVRGGRGQSTDSCILRLALSSGPPGNGVSGISKQYHADSVGPRWLDSRQSFYFVIGNLSSKAKFSSRTFTRGSPRKPNCRPSVCAWTRFSSASSEILRSLATRGIWNSAPAGVMCGSSPEPEVVTRSTGTGLPGFSDCRVVTSVFTRSTSFWLVGPKLLPEELSAAYPLLPAAEGLGWKYAGPLNGWARIREPTTTPFLVINWPFALSGQRRAKPVITRG